MRRTKGEGKVRRVLVIFGTRPEAIKMAPVIRGLEERFTVKVCVTAQHREMLDPVLELFDIAPDYDLNLMRPGQNLFDLTSSVLTGLNSVLSDCDPDIVLVHGDTTTTMSASLAAFYSNIPVGHVEAGLRTYNAYSPFPEEINRQVTARIATMHFAPTEGARQNLISENISSERVFVTGNTVIDALFSILEEARNQPFPDDLLERMPFLKSSERCRIILVTGHRRENFGQGFEDICKALREIAKRNNSVELIYPVHLNPNVKNAVERILSNINNVHLVRHLDYIHFVKLMDLSSLILTDSGGIQEEAPSLGKPVLVLRNTTERPEAIEAGTVKLVGTDKRAIVEATCKLLSDRYYYSKMATAHNPYGDGQASERIRDLLGSFVIPIP